MVTSEGFLPILSIPGMNLCVRSKIWYYHNTFTKPTEPLAINTDLPFFEKRGMANAL
jgi:hypothetical protein